MLKIKQESFWNIKLVLRKQKTINKVNLNSNSRIQIKINNKKMERK